MKITLEARALGFLAKYSFEIDQQKIVDIGSDPICDLVLPKNLFTNIPRKVLSFQLENEGLLMEALNRTCYLSLNDETFLEKKVSYGKYNLQINDFLFSLILEEA